MQNPRFGLCSDIGAIYVSGGMASLFETSVAVMVLIIAILSQHHHHPFTLTVLLQLWWVSHPTDSNEKFAELCQKDGIYVGSELQWFWRGPRLLVGLA